MSEISSNLRIPRSAHHLPGEEAVALWRVVPRGGPVPTEPPVPEPQNPLHWGYNPWGPPPPPPRTAYKRAHSEDDCEDVFSEESIKEECSSPSDPDSCQHSSRKKRRGIIEKRRRDRINTSLSELRRLVPSAYEKQGSAKLEKAEILQMTVDHLKTMHSKGVSYDPSKFAMDYQNFGFQECAAEVARYLATVEGLDIQDPLRMRLMSHLQCFAAQRELATKQNWYSTPPPVLNPSQSYQSSTLSPISHVVRPPPITNSILHSNPSHLGTSSLDSSMNSSNSLSNSLTHSINSSLNSSFEQTQSTPPASTPQSSSSTVLTTLTPISSTADYYSQNQLHSMDVYQHNQMQQHYGQATDQSVPSQMKPYRPWGAEVAY